jgi:ComF family protein
LRQAIHQLKYDSLRALAAPLGELMGQGWEYLAPRGIEIDAIVPVPLHHRRQRERGYNQAALLARVLGQKLGVPVDEGMLARIRHTRPQVGLNVAQRQANLLGAFQHIGSGASRKRLLLVDDVCTSGSTLQEAAAALRQGGASKVWAYTLTQAHQ